MSDEHCRAVIGYMKKKAEVLEKYFGIDNYFLQEDEDAISQWEYWEMIGIHDKMKSQGESNLFIRIFSSSQCPFCIKGQGECEDCEYMINHGQCDDINSDYKKTIRPLIDKNDKENFSLLILIAAANEIKGFAYYENNGGLK